MKMQNKWPSAIDVELEARRIIKEHTEAYMNATVYKPDDNEELWETMISECSYILTEEFLDGKFSPIQYNDIRNKIAVILYEIFSPICYKSPGIKVGGDTNDNNE